MAATAPTLTGREDLFNSLERHNAAFTTLLGLIPAQYYIAPDPEVADSKWMKNKKRKTGEEIKEHKKKSKQEKLDPASQLTTADLLEAKGAPGPSGEGQDQDQPEAGPSSSSLIGKGTGTNLVPLPPSASISELRAKLQSRLDSFRRDRGVNEDDTPDAASRNELEEARRKKRGEMRDRRRNERKEERRKGRDEPTAKPAKTQLIVPQLRDEPTDTLSFPSVSLPSGTKSKNKTTLKQLSNPAQALAQLEKHNAHLASLPEDRRKELEERERWAKAEERAAGGKVADQEKILKKAVKRVEKTKAKSGKEWADRKREIEKSSSIAIKKRNDNIAKRVDDKRNKRLGIKDKGKGGKGGHGGKGGKGGKGGSGGGGGSGGKKGGSRPGFEGKGKGKA